MAEVPIPPSEIPAGGYDRPRMRPVELMPVDDNGEKVIMVRDPSMCVEEPLVVSPLAGLIVTLFNGHRSLAEVQALIQRQVGCELEIEDLRRLAEQFDKCLMLDSNRFHEYHRERVEAFLRQPTRSAHFAGAGYPAEEEELRDLMASFFADDEGPGFPSPRPANEAPEAAKAIVAPHVDLSLGGPTFAHAYRALAESRPADLYVILGTGHAGPRELFTATSKDFATPLGVLETDRDFLRQLDGKLEFDLFADEFMHKSEHVIEFQALFLRFLFGDRPNPPVITPILCSYAPDMAEEFDDLGDPVATGQRVARFAQALRETMAECGKRVCVIASVDMAHVGPRYGDAEPPTAADLAELERDDLRTLEIVAQGDAAEFSEHLLDDENNERRRICGFPCIHTMLRACDLSDGEILKYDQTQIDGAGSVVSFGGMIFH